jgi:hypothetical protein
LIVNIEQIGERWESEVLVGIKVSWIGILIVMFVIMALVVAWSLTPMVARAQCGTIVSSCYACHTKMVTGNQITEWHSTFGHRYACWNCHGGNDTALNKEQAHIGLISNPLVDVYANCYFCHPADYQQRAHELAQTVGTGMQ